MTPKKGKFLKFNVFQSEIIFPALFIKNPCKANTIGKQLHKIGSLKIKPLKTLGYTPSL